MKPCSVEGCERKYHGKGLCNFHYVEMKKQTAPACSQIDCEKPSRAKGMCSTHYDKFLRGKDVEEINYEDYWRFVKNQLGIA